METNKNFLQKYKKYKIKYTNLKKNISQNYKKKYAILTLLMLGDGYLPGC